MIWTTLPRCELPGGLAAYRVGSGPELVLIHGVGLCAEAWEGMFPALTARFTVTAIDLPGHGRSAALPATSLAPLTDRIVAALTAPALVVGHSLGAQIALDMAIRHPARVRAVAALNAVYRRSAGAAAAIKARADALSLTESRDPTATLLRWFGDNPQGPNAEAARACRDWLGAVMPESYAAAYRILAEHDGPPDAGLRAIRCPALFLTGADEPNSTPAMSRAMAALAPDGRASVVAGAAHMAPMTHAATVSHELLAFFAPIGGAS